MSDDCTKTLLSRPAIRGAARQHTTPHRALSPLCRTYAGKGARSSQACMCSTVHLMHATFASAMRLMHARLSCAAHYSPCAPRRLTQIRPTSAASFDNPKECVSDQPLLCSRSILLYTPQHSTSKSSSHTTIPLRCPCPRNSFAGSQEAANARSTASGDSARIICQ